MYNVTQGNKISTLYGKMNVMAKRGTIQLGTTFKLDPSQVLIGDPKVSDEEAESGEDDCCCCCCCCCDIVHHELVGLAVGEGD